jgi:GNAT superfamily N-acetyltransferase
MAEVTLRAMTDDEYVRWVANSIARYADSFVYDIEMDETQRGKGYGRATMLAGEVAARELGATTMGLNVFGFNTAAINLYTSLGCTVSSQNMMKTLG